jgi:chromosome segregation ATPase
MQNMRMVPLLLLCLTAPTAFGEKAHMNPLSEVISLMDSLSAKITKEGEAEAKAYKEYFDWCDDASKNKGFEIKTLTAKKESLDAEISKLTGDASASGEAIEKLAASIAADESELKDATLIRAKEAKEFATNEAELVDTIDTLSRAVSILEKEMAKNPAAFAQMDTSNLNGLVKSLSALVDAASFSGADQKKLLGLVQSQESGGDDDDAVNAPAAAVYKTHSSSIFDVLEDLKEKAEDQLADLRKAETNTKHNYEMLKQSLQDQVAADTKAKDEETAAKAAAEEGTATAESDLAETVKALEDAKSTLATANANCMQTAADHAATVAARTEELKTIAKAKEILRSTTPGAESQAYSLFQLTEAASTGSQMHTRMDLANAEVVNMVKQLAQKHHSAALAQLASRISAVLRYSTASGDDPFVKVKGLIVDLINKLEAQASAEATEKDYCDEQMEKTEAKKAELDEDIAKLTTKIDQAAAASAGLKADVKELQAELASLAKTQADMDKIRSETHSDYVQAKSDLELGLDGVRKALGVLRDYYGSAAAAAMLQDSADGAQPVAPELHAKATGAGDSIIGILEVVESDFATDLAKEESAEADAEAEYEKMTQENSVTKTLKVQDVKYKTQEFTGLDKKIADLTSDKDTESAELAAVMEYYGKIKDRCIAVPETYEERKARRAAEIQGLKEALNTLETETALVQRRKRGLRGHYLGMN